ncbi:MAG TPA: acyclic terpene utilization AtuA family protein [Bradyrhizobium sp.]|nr:acyclic terpene utilization AtuA family protein [Bradyrhizobium sp.]
MRTIRIGSGAGYSGDRIEPALELAEKGNIQYLVFECLGERTVALAQQARMKNTEGGFDPLLEERMRAVLPVCAAKGIKIVTNMGAANPAAAARKTVEVAKSLGLARLKIAAVLGDDVLDACKERDLPIMEFDGTIKQLGNRLLSANAYLGAEPMAEALSGGADVVITGRASDPALFLAPMVHAFGWAMDDWNLLGQGTLGGHLLECAGQITGGYFADPGYKDVVDLARLGFPIGEVREDGDLVITKVAGSGGAVTARTCKEQLLYEVHDPAQYIQPDVVADFAHVTIEEVAPDRVRVSGGRGARRPDTLKVSVGYLDGYIGEGQISYAGPGAVARGRLGLEIVRERLKLTGVAASEWRFELIGVDSLHGANHAARAQEPYEVRLRVAGRTESLREAVRIGNEVETLYTNGPAAGGGVFKSARDVVAVASVLLPRELAHPQGTIRGGISDEAARTRPFPHRRQGQHLEHFRDRL